MSHDFQQQSLALSEQLIHQLRISDECCNFGSKTEHYALLEDKYIVAITCLDTSLEDNASQLSKIRSGNNLARATLDLMGFMNTTLRAQLNIDKLGTNQTPCCVPVLELLQPPELPEKLFSAKNVPKCKGVRVWYFLGKLGQFKNTDASLSKYLHRYILLNIKRIRKRYPQMSFETAYGNMTTYEQYLGMLQARTPSINYMSLLSQVSSSQSVEGTLADPAIALRMDMAMLNYNGTIDIRQCLRRHYFNRDHRRDEHGVEIGTKRLYDHTMRDPLDADPFLFPLPSRCYRIMNHNVQNLLISELPQMVENAQFMEQMEEETSRRSDFRELEARGVIRRNEHTGEFQHVNNLNAGQDVDPTDLVSASFSPEEKDMCIDQRETVSAMLKRVAGAMASVHFIDKYDPDKLREESEQQRQRMIKHAKEFMARRPELAQDDDAEKDLQELIAINVRKFYDLSLRKFVQRFDSTHPHISPYVVPILRFMEKYKEEHNNSLFFRFRKQSSNLSLIEDVVTYIVHGLEKYMLCETCHDRVFNNLLSQLNSSDPIRAEKFSTLAHGPNSSSKSFAAECAKKLLIGQTGSVFTYKTTKADSAGGNFDCGFQIMNEVQSGYLGQNPNKIGGARSNPQNDEQCTMFKDITTSGMMTLRECYIDPKTGVRYQRETTSYRNNTFQMCTNLFIQDCDPASLSRFLVMECMEISRPGREIIDLIGRCETPEELARKQDFIRFISWLQMHVQIVDFMLNLGYLSPVNLNFLQRCLVQILKWASAFGVINAKHPRKTQRVLCLIRLFIKLRAIVLVFSSNLDPKRYSDETEHTFMDHITLQGQLHDNDFTCLTLALTATSSYDYEDKYQFRITRMLELLGVFAPFLSKARRDKDASNAKSDGNSEDGRKQHQQPNQKKRYMNFDDDAEEKDLLNFVATAESKHKEQMEASSSSSISATTNGRKKLKSMDDEPDESKHPASSSSSPSTSSSSMLVSQRDLEEAQNAALDAARISSSSSSPPPPPPKTHMENLIAKARLTQTDLELDGDAFYTPERREILNMFKLNKGAQDDGFLLLPLNCLSKPPIGGADDKWCIQQLTNKILALMPVKPPRRKIVDILWKLNNCQAIREMTGNGNDPTVSPSAAASASTDPIDFETESEKPFRFVDGALIVHQNLFLMNHRNRMEKAMRMVLEPIMDRPTQDVIFGWKRGEHFQEFNVITLNKKQPGMQVDPKTNVERLVYDMIDNPQYVSKASREFDKAIIDPFSGRIDPLAEQKQMEEVDITSTPYLMLDESHANLNFLQHLKNIYWDAQMVTQYNVMSEAQTQASLILAHRVERENLLELQKENPTIDVPSELKRYPDNMGLVSRKELEDKKMKDMEDPEMYGKYSTKPKLQNLLKAFVSADPNRAEHKEYFNLDRFRTGELPLERQQHLADSIRHAYQRKMEKAKQDELKRKLLEQQQQAAPMSAPLASSSSPLASKLEAMNRDGGRGGGMGRPHVSSSSSASSSASSAVSAMMMSSYERAGFAAPPPAAYGNDGEEEEDEEEQQHRYMMSSSQRHAMDDD